MGANGMSEVGPKRQFFVQRQIQGWQHYFVDAASGWCPWLIQDIHIFPPIWESTAYSDIENVRYVILISYSHLLSNNF